MAGALWRCGCSRCPRLSFTSVCTAGGSASALLVTCGSCSRAQRVTQRDATLRPQGHHSHTRIATPHGLSTFRRLPVSHVGTRPRTQASRSHQQICPSRYAPSRHVHHPPACSLAPRTPPRPLTLVVCVPHIQSAPRPDQTSHARGCRLSLPLRVSEAAPLGKGGCWLATALQYADGRDHRTAPRAAYEGLASWRAPPQLVDGKVE